MKSTLFLFMAFISIAGFTQQDLKTILNKHSNNSVTYMTVQELNMPKTQVKLLDAREKAEYDVSHIKNALHVGYNDFDIKTVLEHIKDKRSKVVVYCSIGIRSEDIGEQLIEAGYTNVYNLYGGIFEWKNADLPVYTNDGLETDKVHAYSKNWGKWLNKGVKVYD